MLHELIVVVLSLSTLRPGASAASVPVPRLASLAGLTEYVGTYPCTSRLLEAPVLNAALRKALGRDFKAYKEHLSVSGCGAIEKHGRYLVVDLSQMHVGGYSSLVLVEPKARRLHVFWLQSTVSDKLYAIYGPRPVPAEVMAIISEDMNVSWGHVARFTVRGEYLDIASK